MNNSFNICPRCGSSNSLNARYCSRCGAQLKVPEEAIVCHKCHTRNSPMANFCRNCGTTLKVGLQTKICPRCGAEVDAEDNVCKCGYSFVTIRQAQPEERPKPVDVNSTNQDNKPQSKQKTKREYKPYKRSGGRVIALFALLLLAVFAYVAFAPTYTLVFGQDKCLRLQQLWKLDNGITHGDLSDDETGKLHCNYGYNYTERLVCSIYDSFYEQRRGEHSQLDYVMSEFADETGTLVLGELAITGCCVVFALCAIIHLLVCIIRLFSGRRSKHANMLYLILALLTGAVSALIILTEKGTLSLLPLPVGCATGWVIYAIPVYFLFFFLYSLLAKAKCIKSKK